MEGCYLVLRSASDTNTILRTQGRLEELTFLLGERLPGTLLAVAKANLLDPEVVDYDIMDHEIPLDPLTFKPIKETAQ